MLSSVLLKALSKLSIIPETIAIKSSASAPKAASAPELAGWLQKVSVEPAKGQVLASGVPPAAQSSAQRPDTGGTNCRLWPKVWLRSPSHAGHRSPMGQVFICSLLLAFREQKNPERGKKK